MQLSRIVTLALALASALPLAAAAAPAGPAAPSALTQATNDYFAALGSAHTRAFERATSPEFHVILPDGTDEAPGDFLAVILAHHLSASTPIQSVRISAVSVTNSTATETVDVSSWDNVQNGTRLTLERDYSAHKLTFSEAADGRWLLDEDHITSASHII